MTVLYRGFYISRDNFDFVILFMFIGLTYKEKKQKISAAWSSLRPSLFRQFVTNAFPVSFQCCVCGCFQEDIIRCSDCGPSAYFCQDCCLKQHMICKLHIHEIWDPQVTTIIIPAQYHKMHMSFAS